MLRLTETRGSRSWPAAVQASRNSWICSACSWWNGTPVSSVSRVELIRFMPCSAVHTRRRVRVPAPHQMRSRSPGECGSMRSSPGGFGNIGRGLGSANPSPLEHLEEDVARARRAIVGVVVALGGHVAEVAVAVDDLLR